MKKDNARPSRSDKYQYIINEFTIAYETLISFGNGQSLNGYSENQQYLEIKDALIIAVVQLAEDILTERQWGVLRMSLDGYTQQEIANHYKVNQSSITKSLHGNVDYKRQEDGSINNKVYGGSTKKLINACKKNAEIQLLLQQLEDARDE